MQRPRSICILFLLALVSAGSAFSQAVNGSLLGTVTDASGATLPHPHVVMTEPNTCVGPAPRTVEAVISLFGDVQQEHYSVSVEWPGFKKTVKSGVDVLVNTTIRADLTLQPGTVTEVINVTAEVAILQTDRSDV